MSQSLSHQRTRQEVEMIYWMLQIVFKLRSVETRSTKVSRIILYMRERERQTDRQTEKKERDRERKREMELSI